MKVFKFFNLYSRFFLRRPHLIFRQKIHKASILSCYEPGNYHNLGIETNDESSDETETKEDRAVENLFKSEIQQLYGSLRTGHNICLIQPRLKQGPERFSKLDAGLKLDEAVALIETLPNWFVLEKLIVPVISPHSPLVFGKGNLEKLKNHVNSNPRISAIFLGVNMLTALQNTSLEDFFGMKVYDRYQIVLQIFHDHARTKEAKLQIALAEIPYLRVKLAAFSHTFDNSNFQEISQVGGTGETMMEIRRRILFDKELKLKQALEKVKKQRELLRRNESRSAYPIVAVVGYTNCGKTTLIKSLTNDARLIPEDKLFATLDVTLHAGLLPSTQKVLYVDTVGFISDVPTTLIQCFRATLEDALLADVIIHVRDISHPNTEMQKQVVLQTLTDLKLPEKLMNSIIEVGNKVDLLENPDDVKTENLLLISASKGNNIDVLLEEIEGKVMENTDQQILLFKVPNGGEEYRWLKSESAIRDAMVIESDQNMIIVEAVISQASLGKFIHRYGDMTISVNDLAGTN